MNWQEIKVSKDNTYFLFNGKRIFDKIFIEVLKFHSPGFAPVRDFTGAYHIDADGNELYKDRYKRTFGFYHNRAAVVDNNNYWFHINEKGVRVYIQNYSWVGNYQENICTVRDFNNQYFHIDIIGNPIYTQKYAYAGDFRDEIACVKCYDGFFRHINCKGEFINDKAFLDLGVFHKNFATAKDEYGWFHIDKNGNEIYKERYLTVEPFYNGFALVTSTNNKKMVIDENGKKILTL